MMGLQAKTHQRALRTRSVSAAIILAICVLGACSCGAGTKRLDKREYIRQLRAIEDSGSARRAWRLYGEVVLTQPALPQAACRARTNELHRTLGTIVARIEQLRPPAEVEQLQRQLIAAARESMRALGKAADDVAAGRIQCGRPLNRRISGLRSSHRAAAVLRAYAKRGYTIGLNSD
jgi:outer membrane murein-binding lipoprotein Lpp